MCSQRNEYPQQAAKKSNKLRSKAGEDPQKGVFKALAKPLSGKKNLPEAKSKSFGLIQFAEEISKQYNIDFVIWLLVLTLIQIYKEKEQVELGEIRKAQFKEKEGSGKQNGAKSCVLRDKEMKEKPSLKKE